ncbi:MAG: acyl-CoA dehydrogenase family protein [Planctomycetes bacterium]|nr:acyl-CoA dehydrogenase family protein [Planctomycetota bacterium]
MDFHLPEELVLLQETVRKFAAGALEPIAAACDREHRYPAEALRAAGELGFMGVMVPEKYGGSSMGNLAGSLIVEEISRACASSGVTISVHNSLVCAPLAKHGTERQKELYLPKLASGEWVGAYALTEPNAGSDAANQQTRAERRNGKFILNGSKLFITTGAHAGLYLVFARTSLEDPARPAKGVTAFLIERGFKGFTPGKPEEKCGIRATSTTELLMEDCEVPAENVLGEVGKGFNIAMENLEGGRIGIASQAIGIAQACLDASLKYAKERRQFGRPIASFQAIQWKLAEMATNLEASRLLVRKAAWLRDRGEPCSLAASMAKQLAAVMANRAADEAVQIHGGAGYTIDFPVERYMRDARITEIYEGTTEIQHLVIARHLLGDA